MNSDLQNKLYKSYPLIFAEVNDPSACSSIKNFGVECGNGWFNMLDELCSKVEPIIREWAIQNPDKDHPRAYQIKSKFGGLRFYMSCSYDSSFMKGEAGRLISSAEIRSNKICSSCGESGEKRCEYGVKTLCDKCHEKNVKEMENRCKNDSFGNYSR